MQLHHLPKLKRKTERRVGRGGKRGTYSGRGIKGQKARAGRKIRPAVRDTILRLPKHRGVTNPPRAPKSVIVNIEDLSGLRGIVDEKTLTSAGIVKLRRGETVKILSQGEVKIPLFVRGLKVSHQAREKIERAGGRVESFVQKSERRSE